MSGGKNAATGRPRVLALLVEAGSYFWGDLAKFEGTAEELVGAGLIEREWLAEDAFGPSGQRSHCDEYGTKVVVHRRGRRRFHLEFWMTHEEAIQDFDAKYTRKLKWFRDHGAEFDTAVADALARMRAPRKVTP